MPLYETVFMTRQDVGPQQVEELTKAFTDILTADGGKINKVEQWGLRTLAYRINKARKAHYTLVEFTAPATALHEMERQMRIHEDVIRYLSIVRDEPSKAPSPVINKDIENETYSREEEAA